MSSLTNSDTCTCVNGGRCLNTEFQKQICECPSDFYGPTCADIVFDLSQDSNSKTDLHIIVIVTLTLCVFAMTSLFCFFTWRRINSIKKHRDAAKIHRNRRQSRVTIEGSSHPGNYYWESEDSQLHSSSCESVVLTQNEIETATTDSNKHPDGQAPVKVIINI